MKKIFLIICLCFSIVLHATDLRIMSYNVQNLFDDKHDNGKNDFNFVKKQSASKRKHKKTDRVSIKISQIARVIEFAGCPDFIVLQEVENYRVLSQLAKKVGYQNFWISNSFDRRGIDIAILYKANKVISSIKFKEIQSEKFVGRSIVKVTISFKHHKNKIILMGVHLPSLLSSTEQREFARLQLEREVKKISRDDYLLVLGDFNLDNSTKFFSSFKRVVDLHLHDSKSIEVPGTYFFSQKCLWYRFDRFFVDKKLLRTDSDYSYLDQSYQILVSPWMTEVAHVSQGYFAGSTIVGTPKGYDHKAASEQRAGFSDHFPIVMTIGLK